MGYAFQWNPLLGSKVNKLSKILVKTWVEHNILDQKFKTLRHHEQMILSSSTYKKLYLEGSLEGVLDVIQVSSFRGIHTISR